MSARELLWNMKRVTHLTLSTISCHPRGKRSSVPTSFLMICYILTYSSTKQDTLTKCLYFPFNESWLSTTFNPLNSTASVSSSRQNCWVVEALFGPTDSKFYKCYIEYLVNDLIIIIIIKFLWLSRTSRARFIFSDFDTGRY